ncbi:MAG: hypothetical protein ACTHKV_00985, partial [Flavipsychrobacter sp.]
PEVIKRVAIEIVTDDFDESDFSGWKEDWIRFFKEVLLQTNLPEKDELAIDEWSTDISEAFARKFQVLKRYTAQN